MSYTTEQLPNGVWIVRFNDDGAVGAQGAAGAQGSQGAVGAQGSAGAQGAVGAQGAAGAAGSQGSQGAAGSNGAQGAQGTAGAAGAQGAAGSNGSQGAQGTAGAQGAQGAAGSGVSGLTTGRIALSVTSTSLTDSANLAWDNTNQRLNLGGATSSANKDIYFKKTVAGDMAFVAENPSTGGTAQAYFVALNSSGNGGYFGKHSTGYTTIGLLLADQAFFYNSSGTMLFTNVASADIIFSIGGTATANEAARLTGTKFSLGNTTSAATATPQNVNLGGTYGNGTVGKQFKIVLYDDGTSNNPFGIGISAALLEITAGAGSDTAFFTNATTPAERMRIDVNGNVTIGSAALATNATNGFLYIPTCAGTPTGTPAAKTGRAPLIIDSTNGKAYFYSGAWIALN